MRAAHRRSPVRRSRFIRTLVPTGVVAATVASFLVFATNASAAGTWWVQAGGSTASGCGTQALPCATVTIVIGKATFVSGDTINVGAGTYADHPLFSTKTAVLNGAGTATTIFDGTNTQFALGSTLPASATLTLNN